MVIQKPLYPDLSCLSWPSCSKKVVIVNDDDGLRKWTLLDELTYPFAMRRTKKWLINLHFTSPVPPLEDDERYLESDGKPMAETERHRHLMVDTLHTLESHFAEVPEVCISGDIMMYYIEGDYWFSVVR